jgi:hypothetical protein
MLAGKLALLPELPRAEGLVCSRFPDALIGGSIWVFGDLPPIEVPLCEN